MDPSLQTTLHFEITKTLEQSVNNPGQWAEQKKQLLGYRSQLVSGKGSPLEIKRLDNFIAVKEKFDTQSCSAPSKEKNALLLGIISSDLGGMCKSPTGTEKFLANISNIAASATLPQDQKDAADKVNVLSEISTDAKTEALKESLESIAVIIKKYNPSCDPSQSKCDLTNETAIEKAIARICSNAQCDPTLKESLVSHGNILMGKGKNGSSPTEKDFAIPNFGMLQGAQYQNVATTVQNLKSKIARINNAKKGPTVTPSASPPPQKLSDAEVQQLKDFISGLPKTTANPSPTHPTTTKSNSIQNVKLITATKTPVKQSDTETLNQIVQEGERYYRAIQQETLTEDGLLFYTKSLRKQFGLDDRIALSRFDASKITAESAKLATAESLQEILENVKSIEQANAKIKSFRADDSKYYSGGYLNSSGKITNQADFGMKEKLDESLEQISNQYDRFPKSFAKALANDPDRYFSKICDLMNYRTAKQKSGKNQDKFMMALSVAGGIALMTPLAPLGYGLLALDAIYGLNHAKHQYHDAGTAAIASKAGVYSTIIAGDPEQSAEYLKNLKIAEDGKTKAMTNAGISIAKPFLVLGAAKVIGEPLAKSGEHLAAKFISHTAGKWTEKGAEYGFHTASDYAVHALATAPLLAFSIPVSAGAIPMGKEVSFNIAGSPKTAQIVASTFNAEGQQILVVQTTTGERYPIRVSRVR